MTFLLCCVFLSSWTTVALSFPHHTFLKRSRSDFESSASGPDESLRGRVKVVPLDDHALAQSGLFRRGLFPRRSPSLASRSSFPAFLSHGRPGPGPGPASASKAPVSPLNLLRSSDLKKKQGLQMWQRAVDKGNKRSSSVPVNLKDAKQSCTALSFTQRVTADGCDAVTVHNKLCFGQCSSLFVPSEGGFVGSGAPPQRAPCSRCAPSRAHTITVPLRCGATVREKRVMVVDECKCETGGEERGAEAAAVERL